MEHERLAIVVVSALVGFAVLLVLNWLPQRGSADDPSALQELIFIYGGTCYHIHHYLLFLPLIGLLWLHRLGDRALYAASGFLLGASLEDLLWGDWYKIRNNCHLDLVSKLQRS
tara:strand:+ start:565 stop:906 length:342 start_codon:yes stop_codon:yes gene_type:complete